jgi:predicted DCC family thiol-disulfide oxidoreductase YuxK
LKTQHNPIIFFDGVCNLCNSSVNFIIERDKKNIFHFASLQSKAAKDILGEKYPKSGTFDTILYLENNKLYTYSTAILRIGKKLPFPYPLLYFFIIVPPFLRNYIYGIISRNRYKWFGKKDQCMIPTPEQKAKFLNS